MYESNSIIINPQCYLKTLWVLYLQINTRYVILKIEVIILLELQEAIKLLEQLQEQLTNLGESL